MSPALLAPVYNVCKKVLHDFKRRHMHVLEFIYTAVPAAEALGHNQQHGPTAMLHLLLLPAGP